MTATLERPVPGAPASPPVAAPVGPPPAVAAPSRRRNPSTAALVTALLLLSGVLLGFLAYLFVLAPLQQDRTQQTLYDSLAADLELATVPVDGVIQPGTPVAVLEIPVLGLRQVVVEGTAAGQLMKGPGHRRDTVLPGQAGISVVQGRSALFGGPFGRIGELQPGDVIVVTTGQGESLYAVSATRDSTQDIPPPSAAAGVLTLVTASPPLAPDRSLIVTADLTTAVLPGRPDTTLVAGAEKSLAGDPSAALPLMLWTQVLLLVVIAVTWAYLRWERWPTYLLSTPVLLAVLWNVYENAAQLLPNTM